MDHLKYLDEKLSYKEQSQEELLKEALWLKQYEFNSYVNKKIGGTDEIA